MHVISRKKLLQAVSRHSDLAIPLDVWFRVAKRARWRSLAEVRKVFPSADKVGKYTIFNIKGNAYRLIVECNYRTARLFVRHVLTHAEYDEGKWKDD